MRTKKYISASQAAKLANVTTVTIRNMCKAGVFDYQLRHQLYYPAEQDVLKYKKSISEIHRAYTSIEQYKAELLKEEKEYEHNLASTKQEYREKLRVLDMFPRRIEHIRDFCFALLEGINRNMDIAYDNITRREYDTMWNVLSGKEFWKIGDDFLITANSARNIWYNALRKLVKTKGLLAFFKNRVIELENEVLAKNVEIQALTAKMDGKTDIVLDMNTRQMCMFLDSRLQDKELTVRSLNCLKWAGIETVRDLVQYRRSDLLKFRNFGKRSLTELGEFLENNRLAFGMNLSMYPKCITLEAEV